MTPKEILVQAAEAIRKYGWCKGSYIDSTGGLCAIGAINFVVHGDATNEADTDESIIAEKMLESALIEYGRSYYIAEWNDEEAENKEEVIEVLLEASNIIPDEWEW
jgi:hypothetical protein